MSNNPFLADVDAESSHTSVEYWFSFDNGHLATATSTDGGPWCLEIHRPVPGRGQRDLETWTGLDVPAVTRILDELRAEPGESGFEVVKPYPVPADA